MTCEEIKNRIVQRILMATAGSDPAIDEHLRTCDDCRQFAERIAAQHRQLKGLARTMDSRIRDNQARILEQLNGPGQVRPSSTIPIWRKIMKNQWTRWSAAAALLIAVLLLVYILPMGSSSVAFAAVLQKICNSSYTFELKFAVPDTAADGKPIQGSILEPGRMRLDCEPMPGLGAISSIIDVQSSQCLILFHQQKAAELLTNPVPSRNAGGGGFATFVTRPVKELWNLRDGKEKSLGKKTIDGVEAEGFEVQKEDEGDIPREKPLHYTIQIWANAKTAAPVLVEIASLPLDSSHEAIKWSMSHFTLDVQLDESLFKMEPPAGYTLSHQKDLKEVVGTQKSSPQGQIVVEAVALAAQKKTDEAIAKLLTVDWSKPVVFEGTAYIFTMSEKQYITLKPDDQQKAMQKVLDDAGVVKQIARTIREKARPMIEAGQYDKAEPMLKAGEQLGVLLTQDPERMILVRLVGIAVQKMMLDDLGKLYESQGKTDLLQKSQQRLQAVQAEGDAIKKAATGKS
jgi:hypothetical protein